MTSAKQTWMEDDALIRDAIAKGYGLDHEHAAALLCALTCAESQLHVLRSRSQPWRDDVDVAGVTWAHADAWLDARGITYDSKRDGRDRVGGDERIHLVNRMAHHCRMDPWRVLDEMAGMEVEL